MVNDTAFVESIQILADTGLIAWIMFLAIIFILGILYMFKDVFVELIRHKK